MAPGTTPQPDPQTQVETEPFPDGEDPTEVTRIPGPEELLRRIEKIERRVESLWLRVIRPRLKEVIKTGEVSYLDEDGEWRPIPPSVKPPAPVGTDVEGRLGELEESDGAPSDV